MMLIILLEDKIDPTLRLILIVVFFVGMSIVILSKFYNYFEQLYAERYNRPFFMHNYLFKKQLTDNQKGILKNNFPYYKGLNEEHQAYFEHRVATFITNKNFIGRKELKIDDEILVWISSTAIMLTFGFKDYLIKLIDNIIIYPDEFYSKANDNYHKGEFNPQLRTLVLSWKHFKEGFKDNNDNINLGIHEFSHAIHLNSLQAKNISAIIFNDGYEKLINLLSNNESLRKNLIDSKYFREYAYSNQYEFVAVIIETFFETPIEFKQQFPKVYNMTSKMLNFNHFSR